MKPRIYWIDNLRTFGIFFVVLGHTSFLYREYIYSFHMPLFIFISGLLCRKVNISLREFIVSKFRSLMIPYFILSFILFVFWIFIFKNIGESSNAGLSIYKNFIGIFYAQGGSEWMNWGVPMWFIPCLFVLNIIYFIIRKLKWWISVLSLCVLILIFYFARLRLPWSIDLAIICIPFFFAGNKIGVYLIEKRVKKNMAIMTTIACIGLSILFSFFSKRVDLYSMNFGEIYVFYPNAFIGILFWLSLSLLIPSNKIFSEIGKNTLIILAFHLNVLGLVNYIFRYLDFEILKDNLISSIILSVLVLLLFIPVSRIINRFFPFIIGKFDRPK